MSECALLTCPVRAVLFYEGHRVPTALSSADGTAALPAVLAGVQQSETPVSFSIPACFCAAALLCVPVLPSLLFVVAVVVVVVVVAADVLLLERCQAGAATGQGGRDTATPLC